MMKTMSFFMRVLGEGPDEGPVWSSPGGISEDRRQAKAEAETDLQN